MVQKIQIRRDTAANWASVNPVLAEGEQGLETDTLKVKFGNGSSAWNALSYSASGGGGAVTSVAGQTGVVTTSQLATALSGTGTFATKAGGNVFTGAQDFTGAAVTGIGGSGGAVSSVVGQTGAVTGAQIVADSTVAASVAGRAQALVRTTVKTSAYSAAPGDLIPVDTTSGAVTITLPVAPADRSRVAVKHIVQGGANAVTIACGGSDVLNRAGGPVSGSLTLVSQGAVLTYTASQGIWTVEAADLPLSSLLTQLTASYVTWDGSNLKQAGSAISVTASANPADAGFDIIVAAGQSNMWGSGVSTPNIYEDPSDSRVYQFAQNPNNATYLNKMILAADPLQYPLSSGTASGGMGPALVFSRWYASCIPTNRRVLIVPVAVGSTTIQTNWDPAGSSNLYTAAITAVLAAQAAAGANARIAAALWIQGESDAQGNYTGPNYQAKLDALIAGWRTAWGVPTMPFVIGGLVPELTVGSGPAIRAVQVDTPNRVLYSAYAAGPSGQNHTDNLHYLTPGIRIIGRSMFNALQTAKANVGSSAVPAQTFGLVATSGNTQVSLAWSGVTANPAVTDYKVEYKLTSSGTWLVFADGVSIATSTIVTGLTNSSSYDFRVSAINSVGTGAVSATASATPATAATVPGAPTGLSGTGGSASVALTWTAPASNGGAAITDYVVQYRTTAGPGSWTTFADGTSTATSATVTGLTASTSYDFQVAAVNSAGTGAYSTTATASPSAGSNLNDTFTGTNGATLVSHAADSGHSWSVFSGSATAVIASNAISVTAASAAVFGSSCVPASADYSVTADYTFSVTNQISGPSVRAVAAAAQKGYALMCFGGTGFQIWCFNNGSNLQVGSTAVPSGGPSTSETYRLTITAAGTTISGKIQRLSDNNYLTSGGAWQAGVATAITGTNATLSAIGNPALFTGNSCTIDNVFTS